MKLTLRRLRPGEVIAGGGGLVLLIVLVALPWYATRVPAGRTAAILVTAQTFTGWDALSELRWLLLLTALVAFALVFFQARERAPAIPVSLSVIVTVLALLAILGLVYRVLISVPWSNQLVDARPGAYLGLLAAVAIFYGGVASMRREGILDEDGPGEIETVTPGGAA